MRAPQPPPYAQFLLDQTRANVRQLADTQALDPLLCRQLETLLADARVRAPPEPPARAVETKSRGAKEEKEEKLGKKNKWTREVIKDTSLLPSLVDAAIQASAGPVVTSSQRKNIVDIVSLSQERIANAVTDPRKQRAAQEWSTSSAKSASANMSKGWNALNDNWAKMLEESQAKEEQRRAVKQEEKDLQRELQREREQAGQRGSGDAPAASSPALENRLAQLSTADEGAASCACIPSKGIATAQDGTTQVGAVATTYSPWPGLVLTHTLVATTVDPDETSTLAPADSASRRMPPMPSSAAAEPSAGRTPSLPPQLQPGSPPVQPPPQRVAHGAPGSHVAPPMYTTGVPGAAPAMPPGAAPMPADLSQAAMRRDLPPPPRRPPH